MNKKVVIALYAASVLIIILLTIDNWVNEEYGKVFVACFLCVCGAIGLYRGIKTKVFE
ncbi:MAG: hypothetical protein LBM62_00095 [Mediterranea sp.]|jgi:hypothetical protein|nr:hypothetical protein [Mediterranea sp.]